ncbi:MAG: restriction endonuclease subunit S [Clostridia bacterium]|nr:restriction endonuclease subunit S [Clostridia bacterium]
MSTEYTLEELFDLQMGKTPSRNNPEYWNSADYKWISIGDLSKCGKFISETKEYISDTAVSESGISQIPADTVVMSFKLSIGKTAITAEPMYSNEAIMSFRDRHVVDLLPDYIYYMFSGRNWDTGTNKAVMGKTLNKATLSKIKIRVHPIEEQKHIIGVLDKVATVIDARNKELQTLDDLIKARFVEMFGNPVVNSMNWQKQRFDSLCENLDGKRRPITSTDRIEGPYPYYGASGVVDFVADYIFDEDILLISEDGANLLARSTPIAFSVSGKVWVNNHAHVVRFSNFALQKYIEYYFAMISIEDYVTGSTQPKLNQAKLNGMMIPIPSKDKIEKYLCFIRQIDKSKVVVQKALDEAQLLFDSLMQQYFG